jgi:hypothetical protein
MEEPVIFSENLKCKEAAMNIKDMLRLIPTWKSKPSLRSPEANDFPPPPRDNHHFW